MRMLFAAAISIGILCPIGCEQKSGTAPSTDPNKPGEVRKLTLTVSGDHTVTQGGSDDVMVLVNRSHFKDDVSLEVSDLPKGVNTVSKDLVVPGDKNTFTLTLKADPDAPPVKNHEFHIVGKAKDIKSDPLNVKLTIKSKS